ncbi:diaminopimelate epimerase [Paenisporosarcina sp. HGH0030]|uniref:diaminopimelate epimerase n=1 Tax=Paenisporosarcina sp. HGH0030 TaxID=1078085 RepID=UPI00034E5642|nr:diaminopimelate epimerase [Paenisporosarcina sp. HGH0030]EPD53981.1 diaminopimelate epimerase [Paenisporosarcina sp. HGH0030]
MTLIFHKVHGSGNTFYLHEEVENTTYNWPLTAQKMCDPSKENGADGLLIISPSTRVDARMRVYNADGSEASMCGNGLRCVARFVLNKTGKQTATIETMKADLTVRKVDSIFNSIDTYSVEISPVSFELSSLPMIYKNSHQIINEIMPEFSSDIHFTAVSVPNPHLIGIVPIQYIEDTHFQEQLAASFNRENIFFPDGVNVSFVHPVDDTSIFVRTYERGVGFTNACGTAMTASALVAATIKLVPRGETTVYNPGGFVKCAIEQSDTSSQLSLIGNATFFATYTGILSEDGEFNWNSKILHDDEIEEYKELEQLAKQKVKDGWSSESDM